MLGGRGTKNAVTVVNPLREMGLALSGGQRQCVALAQAIIENLKVGLLEEATNAVDVPITHATINAMTSSAVSLYSQLRADPP